MTKLQTEIIRTYVDLRKEILALQNEIETLKLQALEALHETGIVICDGYVIDAGIKGRIYFTKLEDYRHDISGIPDISIPQKLLAS